MISQLVSSDVAWYGAAPAPVIEDAVAAVARLPLDESSDPFERLAAASLAGYPANSAWAGGLPAWWSWCASAGIDPVDARRHHADAWVRVLSSGPAYNGAAHQRSSGDRCQ